MTNELILDLALVAGVVIFAIVGFIRGVQREIFSTAALLGGVSFKGGEGTIFGLITGILIIGVLNNAMQLASFPDFSQNVVKGAVLLIAVGFDVYQKTHKAKETVALVKA